MPKALSLKKTKQTNLPKNQNCITQFFKNTSNGASQVSGNHEVLSQKALPQQDNNKNLPKKRKAPSPVQIDLCDTEDKLSDIPAHYENNHQDDKIHKKVKIKKSLQKTPPKRHTGKISSPEKENSFEVQKSYPTVEGKPLSIDSDENHVMRHNASRNNTLKESPLTEFECSPKKILLPVNSRENTPNSLIVDSSTNNIERKKVKSIFKNHEENVFDKSPVTNDTLLAHNIDAKNGAKMNITPEKSHLKTELRRSPRIAKLLTPEKILKEASIKKALDFGYQDNFGNDLKATPLSDFECSPKKILPPVSSRENTPNSLIVDSSTNKLERKDDKSIFKNHVEDVFDKLPGKNGTPQPNNICAKRNVTPKKSPITTDPRRSPRIAKLLTPEKTLKEASPIKKALDFGHQDDFGDDFMDEWVLNEIEEETVEDLDLTSMQRCEVISVIRQPTSLKLLLKNDRNNRGTCYIEGFWLDTPISEGEILSILATRDSSGKFSVTNTSGLMVLRPDHLVSSTSVVAGVFCKRKAVLQERWRGIDSANSAMTIGTLIHELVQKALTQNIQDEEHLNKEADRIIKESIQLLYDAGLSENECRNDMQAYILPLAEFMQTYLIKKPQSSVTQNKKGKWNGHVNKVLDIEENLCCPELGLKGKIDATLEVAVHDRRGNKVETVPLELKSGKASESAEHRGQLVLYGMMLALQRGESPATAEQRGLLLYLKNSVELREVSCGYPERRDLILLRNNLVKNLAVGPEDVDPEQLVDIEDASVLLQQKLPGPIHRENVCSKCPYLTLCSLHLWHTDCRSVSESHPLSKLRESALGHLTPAHIKYFLHWTALLKIEERGQLTATPLHALWNDSVEKREKRGTCTANLFLKSVQESGDRYLHVFLRKTENSKRIEAKGPQEGEFSIVSIEKRPWIAAGVISLLKDNEIHMLLERDLSRRLPKSTKFHIDTYESYASTVQNLTNLGVLMEDSERAQRLRSLIIDKDVPLFETKQPREVGRLGSKLMRGLNIEQQRAVLRALAARHYALLRGLPGTGKTQTLSVLIQMAVALKMRVLVTAHTHSAVDNLLARLPKTIRIMRLGPKSRVAASLSHCCEQELAVQCETPEQLEKLYDSMEVVGVTCLGASHAMLSRTTFDMCIVDEATQVLQSTVLRPLFAAKRFVLVGDPDQLPPVVRSKAARRLGMEESLFHRLMSDAATTTLALQYRMNAPLAALANTVAYHGKLLCANDAVARARLGVHLQTISETAIYPWLLEACSPEADDAAVFLDIQASAAPTHSRSCANGDEASVVLALVNALIKGGVKPCNIGVIAPYREQVSLLRRTVGPLGVEASTVDQFQGRDKDAIVYSCTRQYQPDGDREVKEGEVLNDKRRLAVSVTRARHKLIVVGDARALRRYESLHCMLQACKPVRIPPADLKLVVDQYRTV